MRLQSINRSEGWIHYYYLSEDNYLSTVSFNIDNHTEQALQEFLEFAKKQFKGYELFLGFSKLPSLGMT